VRHAHVDFWALHAVREGRITMAQYRGECERDWGARLDAGWLSPGELAGVDGGVLEGGDTLFCSCARPGSDRRTHPCHLEIYAPFLLIAGWGVMLWGRPLRLGPQLMPFRANTDERYDPREMGWPSSNPKIAPGLRSTWFGPTVGDDVAAMRRRGEGNEG